MLIEFSVENFLSFKERVTLSLVAAEASEEEETRRNWVGNLPYFKHRLLKTAAIYGANASGKSNLIKAMDFFILIVKNSAKTIQQGQKLQVRRFRLDETCLKKPSVFKIKFIFRKIRYDYEFSLDETRILHEMLISYTARKPGKVFERKFNSTKGIYSYSKGSGWQGEWKTLQSVTRENALFLSVAAQFNNKVAGVVCEWFENNIKLIGANTVFSVELENTNRAIRENPTLKNSVLELLKKADVGISDFQIEMNFKEEVISNLTGDSTSSYDFKIGAEELDLITIHDGVGVGGKRRSVSFDFYEESDGTQKFYTISVPLQNALENGGVLVADELDTRLHPNLTRWIIDLFHNPRTNPKGAQLIFATHEENLLDRKVFRRDQIWFTEKDSKGATRLYSLWDYKARKTEDIRRGYLMGRYGAVPFLESLEE